MAYPDAKNFTAQLAVSAWVTNTAYIGKLVEILSHQFDKIKERNWTSTNLISLNRTDVVLTALYNGDRRSIA